MKWPIFELKRGDSRLPLDLWDLEFSPERIFVQGRGSSLAHLLRLPDFGLAVVGTRQPTDRSLRFTRNLIEDLRKSELVILSGFARGIDTEAHRAALAVGLPTIAIVAGGLDCIYPEENEPLRKQILFAGGLVISESNFGTRPFANSFLERNRLIAAWARATCVIEAPFRSGALNTARWAREYGRLSFAVPCYPGEKALSGNQTLLDRDHAIPVWGAESLGTAWFNLVLPKSTHSVMKIARFPKEQLTTDQLFLIEEVGKSPSGMEVQVLLDRAVELGWSASRFFECLESSFRSRLLLDQNGLVLKNAKLFD